MQFIKFYHGDTKKARSSLSFTNFQFLLFLCGLRVFLAASVLKKQQCIILDQPLITKHQSNTTVLFL
jgi:hypothetical protein